MSAVILIGKLLVILSWVMTIRMILNFRKEEESTEIRFDLLSSMDISVCIGISLVALFSSLEESAALFTLIVIAVALFMINTQRYRILLAGKEKALLKGKTIPLRGIREAAPNVIFLDVRTRRDEKIRILVPLTRQETTQKIYDQTKKKK